MSATESEPAASWHHRVVATVRRGAPWLADACRAPWAALEWNLRKTLYLWRGRRGDCPCHDPSDAGASGGAHCLAVLGWRKPERFRRICPLLERNERGWCCTVGPERVRPYWGRVARTALVWTGLLYLIAGVGAFGLFRRAGLASLGPLDVLWPGRWDRIPAARAALFRERGIQAARQGEVAPALLSLASAWRINPDDYETGLLLAKLESTAGVHAFSDWHFQELLARFPGQAERTAQAWHDQLFASGQWRELAQLCWWRLPEGGRHAARWQRSLLFALQAGHGAADFQAREGASLRARDPGLADLVSILALAQAGEVKAALDRLGPESPDEISPLLRRLRIEWLAAWGDARRAEAELTRAAGHFPPFELAALTYLLSSRSGDATLQRADFRRLWRTLPDDAELDRIFSLLLATRDHAALHETVAQLHRLPAHRRPAARTVCWLVATACGEDRLAAELADAVPAAAQAAGVRFFRPAKDSGAQAVRTAGALLLNTLPLGRETAYALLRGAASGMR